MSGHYGERGWVPGTPTPAPAVSPDRERLREAVVEAMSWAEDFGHGRWGYERARNLLDEYVAALLAERDELARKVTAVERLVLHLESKTYPEDFARTTHAVAADLRRALADDPQTPSAPRHAENHPPSAHGEGLSVSNNVTGEIREPS